jgi:hypothetical protein
MDFFDGVTLTAASMSSYCNGLFCDIIVKGEKGLLALRSPETNKGGDWQ